MGETSNDFMLPSPPESVPSSPKPSDEPDLEWCLQREHDVALIYAEKDADNAFEIMEEMTDGTGLDVRLQTDESFGPNKVDKPKNIASKCWLVLVVHTHNTTDDTVTLFTKNELIGHIRLEQSKDYIRPLCTDSELSALDGLVSIDSLPWDSERKKKKTKKQIKEIIQYRKEEDLTRRVEKLKLKAPMKYCDVNFKRKVSGDSVYEMDSPKGLMVIIDNNKFTDDEKYSKRDSSYKDAEALDKLFHDFGFEVKTETNLTAEGIKHTFEQHLETFGQKSCFAAAILSHGKNGRVLGIDGIPVSFKEIKDIFTEVRWKKHAKKPKLFFIQACQKGEALVDVPTVTTGPEPRESNFYWALASVPGYPAWRDEDGSYFIQCLVDVFRTYAHKYDLEGLMAKVAYNVERIRPVDETEKSGNVPQQRSPQVPERRTTLSKQLYFFPGL